MKDYAECYEKQKQFVEHINYILFSKARLNNDLLSVRDSFQQIIYSYFDRFGRDFSWRQTINPYHIVVSEIMLQQTQTSRVMGKFEQFVARYPSFEHLAQAEWKDVLAMWQGLGYSRRAKALQEIARIVVAHHAGQLPDSQEHLTTFPGIGAATASSICAFAFNAPVVFIETNIRSVFIHFFFHATNVAVSDKEIFPLVAHMLDATQPRQWYYALMDYGVALKRMYPELNKKSAHYVRQSMFEGSNRQMRGKVLKELVARGPLSLDALALFIESDVNRVAAVVDQLLADQLIQRGDGLLRL